MWFQTPSCHLLLGSLSHAASPLARSTSLSLLRQRFCLPVAGFCLLAAEFCAGGEGMRWRRDGRGESESEGRRRGQEDKEGHWTRLGRPGKYRSMLRSNHYAWAGLD